MPSTYARSFVKGILWEGLTFVLTSLLFYYLYGGIVASIRFGFIITLIKMPLYFLNERIWKMIRWGKIKEPPKTNIFRWLPFHSHTHEY